MEFDEMKVIWDEQADRQMYAIDEAALHASVRQRSKGFGRLVLFAETAMMASWVGLAAFYLVDPLARGEEYHRLLSAGILVALALALTLKIVRRRSGEAQFDRSIRGDLDRAIWQVDYHIEWARMVRKWYVPVFLIAVSIDFAFHLTPRTGAIWLGMVLLVGWAAAGIEWEIRALYLPKKQRLETVRRKLVEAER